MFETNRESIDAVYVSPEAFEFHRAAPGEFTIKDVAGRQTLQARLPGGELASCPVDDGGWTWNGSLDKPTLSPSVRVSVREDGRDIELWHGWLRHGRWVSC